MGRSCAMLSTAKMNCPVCGISVPPFTWHECSEAEVDPQRGETWECKDGGAFHIWNRKPKMVEVSRRPWNDSQAERYWMRLSTFNREVVGKR